jgi:hypothetical protein
MSDDATWRPPTSDEIVPSAPGPSARTRRGALVAAVIGVLAIGATGVFAATQLFGGDHGGAASPEELGQQVLDAIDDTDVLGLVDLLVPSERDVVRDPLTELLAELRRLQIVARPAGADGIEGVEFVVERASVRVQPTNVPDITNLRLTGDVTVTVDGDRLPIGSLVSDNIGDLERSELDTTTTEPFDVTLTSIELDGRWYVSLFFSIAEAARAEQSPPPDIPDQGIEPRGGSTPDGALDALLDGVEALDLSRVVAALNPGEAGALQRYGPMFLGAAQDELDLLSLQWDITEKAYTVTGSGSTRSASIDRLAISGRLEGTDFQLELDRGCVVVTSDDEQFDSCAPGDDEATLDGVIGESPAAQELAELIREVFADHDQPGITIRQTDGQWYVSPLGTLFDQLLAGLRALEREDLERFIELGPQLVDDVIGDFFGFDPFDDDGFFDDDFDASAVEECYGLADVDDALACFRAALGAGEVDEWQVAAEMRFPQCGAAEAHWDGYFQMDDDEFIALVERARPCFLELVETGQLDSFDVPLAMSDPECFEGRNWFAVFDDPEYDDRFFDCVGF